MAMRGSRSRRAMADINVVPYIDVMLVLLVIFMQGNHSLLHRESTRKEYALARLLLATSRLMRAESEAEKTLATCWMKAWASVIGDAQFPKLPYRPATPKARRRSPPRPRD